MDFSKLSLSKPDAIFFKKKENGTIVLANAEDDDFSILELEDVSGEIWEKIVPGIDYKALLAWMIDTYDGEPKEIEKDLNEFLEDLVSKKFLLASP